MKLRPVAVIDGIGASATVDLQMCDDDGELFCELPWPEDWPKWVDAEFLREHGFEVITA